MSHEQRDRLQARTLQRIREGVLPDADATRTWAGPGSGLICSVCDAPILETQTEYQLDFEWTENMTRIRETYLFHESCHRIWQAQRRHVRR